MAKKQYKGVVTWDGFRFVALPDDKDGLHGRLTTEEIAAFPTVVVDDKGNYYFEDDGKKKN